jgi:hypothetical protein
LAQIEGKDYGYAEMTTLTEDEKREALEAFRFNFPNWEEGQNAFPGIWGDHWKNWLAAWAASKAAHGESKSDK